MTEYLNYDWDEWITLAEAAELLGYYDGSALRRAIHRGDIVKGQDAIKRRGKWLVRRDAVWAYYEAARGSPAQQGASDRVPISDEDEPQMDEGDTMADGQVIRLRVTETRATQIADLAELTGLQGVDAVIDFALGVALAQVGGTSSDDKPSHPHR